MQSEAIDMFQSGLHCGSAPGILAFLCIFIICDVRLSGYSCLILKDTNETPKLEVANITLLGSSYRTDIRLQYMACLAAHRKENTCKDCWAFRVQRLMQRLHPDRCATVCNTAKQEQIKRYQELRENHGWHWLTLMFVESAKSVARHAGLATPLVLRLVRALCIQALHICTTKSQKKQRTTSNREPPNRNTSRQSQSLACFITFPLVSWLPPASSSLRWQWHHLAPFEVLTQHSQCDHQCGSWINEVCRPPTCCCLTKVKDNNSIHI